MNFYEHHIGDYLRDTAHLSLLEHGVYRRMLDLYYTREEALPLDVGRLIGARSRDERAAVVSVLEEFFHKDGERWIHTRCDAEIARYQEKQRKARASAEARWARAERNANASPNSNANAYANGHANASADEMRPHGERISDRDAPRARTRPRADARTSPQSPVPSPQTPEEIQGAQQCAAISRAPEPKPEPEPPPPPAQPGQGSVYGAAALAMRSRGMSDVTPTDPRLRALVDAGVGLDELSNIAVEAVEKRKGAPWAYKVVAARREEAAAVAIAPKPEGPAWHETRDGVVKRAQQLGIDPWFHVEQTAINRGERPNWPRYRAQVIAADNAAGAAS